MKSSKKSLNTRIPIYHYGIHKGEEPIIFGNTRSGLITFSGCRMRCTFCYTPETSRYRLGEEYHSKEFSQVLARLAAQGAQNINLITAGHVWRNIQDTLRAFKQESGGKVPIIAKIDGGEPSRLLYEMLDVVDVFVPDFKLWTSAAASRLGMPAQYGKNALRNLKMISKNLPEIRSPESEVLLQGVVVRHLLMPDEEEETQNVLTKLREINYSGPINLMTKFYDPKNQRFVTASQEKVMQFIRSSAINAEQFLVDGK